jgi:hypothetical protein
MKTPENTQLVPVAAVVLAVCLTANLVAELERIEPRAARVVLTLARVGRVVASIVSRTFDPVRRAANDADGDDCE